jgi:hypothetical protein
MYVNLPTALTYAVMPTYPTSNLNHLNVMAYASISIFSKIPVHVFSRAQSLRPKRKEKNRDNTHIFQTSLHIPNRPGPIQLYYSLSSITLENLSFSLSLQEKSSKAMPATNTENSSQAIPAATSGSRSKLLSGNFKSFLSKPALTHPQKALTVELHNAEVKSNSGGGAEK